jgi:putative transposase
MRFAFIQRHRDRWPVHVQCHVLQVSRSGYYAWVRRPPSERAQRQQKLTGLIRQVHAEIRQTYGSPRVTIELQAQGEWVCENTVAKLMRRGRIRSKIQRKFVPRTTDSNHHHPVADNLLDRDFAAEAPNRKWACDITYVPTDEGWLYLAVVMDLCSRRIVGWSMADHMRGELVCEALAGAIATRRPADGLLHHSDRGVQYACEDYQDLLAGHDIACSMSRRGDCYDNAVVESFFGTLKTELVNHERYATRQQARASLFEYIEVFYNRCRRHTSIGFLSPEAFEAQFN